MTKFFNSIAWTPTSGVNDKNIAVQVCDSAVDSDFRFVTEGSDINGSGFQASSAILDNMVNSNSVSIIFGIQTYIVSPFTRRTFFLPDKTPQVEIQLTSGVCTLTLCQNDMKVPDEQNQLASAAGGGTVSEYDPWFNRNGVTPIANEVLMAHFVIEPIQYQINFNGIAGGTSPQGGIHPAADYVCAVYRNTVHIGDLTFHTSGTMTATTIGATAGVMGFGDCLTVIGNATPDGSIMNFGATFAMLPV